MKLICNGINENCMIDCTHKIAHEEHYNCTKNNECKNKFVKCISINNKIVGYKILRSFKILELENQIKGYLEDNWTLQGGVSSTTDDDGDINYCQAVVKYE